MQKIAAIIVLYNPDDSAVETLFSTLATQVDVVIVIDNGSSAKIKTIIDASKGVGLYYNQGKNTGIAQALNKGIVEAKKLGVSHVVLFDQDSIPVSNMIETLMQAMLEKTKSGNQVAAVGPRYCDVKGLHVSPVTLRGILLRQINCQANAIVEVDHLISSGCLIAMTAFDAVGTMNESLFIDYVDVAWSLRARSKGFCLYAVCDATMQHNLGDRTVSFMGRKINVHSPLRNYYMIRNGVWLLKQPWVGFNRTLAEFFKLFKKYIVYSLFIGSNYENWKMMSKGIWHALSGKMGEYEK